MKTTVELPDELLRQVKELSRSTGVSMRDLIVEGLRSEVARRKEPKPRADFVFAVADGEGLAADVAPGDAIALSYESAR